MQPEQNTSEPCTVDTKITEVINDPVFEEYGRLIFPVDEAYYSGDTLGSLRLTWYNNIDPEETVKIVNTLKSRAESGETVFYDIYTDEEKEEDPEKIEYDLMKVLPKDHWILYNIQIITFGRAICFARSPKCEECFLRDYCLEYNGKMKKGRK